MINKQQHNTSCGPVAVINCILSLGGKINYREYLPLFESLGYRSGKGGGTSTCQISAMLELFDIKYKLLTSPNIDKITDAVHNYNGCIIYCRKSNNSGGHYMFVDTITKSKVRGWNYSPRDGKRWIDISWAFGNNNERYTHRLENGYNEFMWVIL
jgi:hypothetical protein